MRDLIGRFLARPLGAVLDVGGGPGRYACWLAATGYQVHLVDPVRKLVEQARTASAAQRDRPLALRVPPSAMPVPCPAARNVESEQWSGAAPAATGGPAETGGSPVLPIRRMGSTLARGGAANTPLIHGTHRYLGDRGERAVDRRRPNRRVG